MYRHKRITCGSYQEVEIYRMPPNKRPFARARRVRESTPAQKKLNDKNSIKYFTRLVHLNFTERDLFLDITFDQENLPGTREEVLREVKNYLSRLRRINKNTGYGPLKYIYVISNVDEDGSEVRYHVHLVVSGMDRTLAEQSWSKGYANSQTLQFNEIGITDKALYMAAQGSKLYRKWGSSINLKKPEAIISDKKVTPRMVDAIQRNPEDRAYFEKLYPGWTFTDCQVRTDFINGTMIYIRMRRYDSPVRGGRHVNITRAAIPAKS